MTAVSSLFVPGASGDASFWDPVRDRLTDLATSAIGWPGLGTNPPHPDVTSFDGLVAYAARHSTAPTAIVGQSMGGYVASRLAIEHPHSVSHLVMSATSAGIDTRALGAADWRSGAREHRPNDPDWLFVDQPDLTEALRGVDVPALLLWAEADELSPAAVGERLCELLPRAELVVYPSDSHWFVHDYADDVAARIRRHLAA